MSWVWGEAWGAVSRRLLVRFLCLAVLTIAAMGAVWTGVGRANGPFCPNSGEGFQSIPSGTKCIHSTWHSEYLYIEGTIPTENYRAYDLCALAKQVYGPPPSGGSGANTMPLECSAYHYDLARSARENGYANNGYAELYNPGPSGSFWGWIVF